MDRQVEVVTGTHVVVRVAGAVIAVAHREPGPLHADSRAVLVAEALAALVSEASEQAPSGPGRLVAREATGWLMRDADQLGGDRPIELGIVSPAEDGGLAIFLHGGVTVVLVGDRGSEWFRGTDAAFAVDRVVEPPSRAAALFVDDERGAIPDLPERGIGSLTEGVAPAAGAVLWFETERTRARDRAQPSAGAHRRADGAVASAGAPEHPASTVPDPARSAESDSRLAARLAATQLGRPASEPRLGTSSQATGLEPQSSSGDAPSAGTDARAQVEPPPQPPATGPDSRTESIARSDAPSTVRVVGFKCARAHPTDPRSAFCTVCGMPVDQTQQLTDVVRPPLGMLVTDDGMSHLLAADVVIGRDPESADAVRNGLVALKVEDSSGGMSRAHAEIRLSNWDVAVLDRGSTNGTSARLPGHQDWIRLTPERPLTLVYGAEIMLGNRILRLEPAAPPPFG